MYRRSAGKRSERRLEGERIERKRGKGEEEKR